MSVIEKFSTISNVITAVIDFVANDESVKEDFNDYLNAISSKNLSQSEVQALIIPYIFERRLTDTRQSIISLYLKKNPKIDKFEKSVLNALENSFSSIFEIKRILQNGFEFYNLVNEKTYTAISLVKMTNYRGVYAGQYALSRIFKFENEFYVLEISNLLPASKKDEVYKFAIAKIIEKPEDVYDDNKKKLNEIEKQVAKFYGKFIDCFGADEVITINKNADNLINIYNNYCEDSVEPDKAEIASNIVNIDTYKYFKVEEFNNSYTNFVEKSLGGFSSHKATYDVGIVYDEELGLFILPFFATFSRIFEVKDYTSIEGYKDCVVNFLENDKVPYNIIKRVADKYTKFIDIVNKILETSYNFDELMNHYKADSIDKKIFSSTSVLYSSKVFAEIMGFVLEQENAQPQAQYSDVGRNDPCPCGSGKKYKKCCMQ